MFILYRHTTGQTEQFAICGDPSDFPDGEKRFGKLLKFDERDETYFEIGVLVLVHRDSAIDVFAMGKEELTELEQSALRRTKEERAALSSFVARERAYLIPPCRKTMRYASPLFSILAMS